jgi:Xaa-Pro aminopeptidase
MDLAGIQQALSEGGHDGWLFCDVFVRDPMAYRILGLDAAGKVSRRWFYYVPASGEPVKLAHRVEPRRLETLPGRQDHYTGWSELHQKLRALLGSGRRVAMQYSPMNNVPTVSVVDGGTLELVRSFGVTVVSSADLVQRFEAVSGEAGYRSHCEAGSTVHGIKDEAFALMSKAIHDSGPITEHDVARFILARFEEEGLTSEGAVPIVGFNDHPADPHFEPTAANAYRLHHGDTILVDLWARHARPPGIYYDITWCGFVGERPPALYVEIFNTVCRARDAALEFVRERFAAGRPCCGFEVDQAARRVVEQAGHGAAFVHRTGHSIGIEVHGRGANIDDLETRDERRIVPGTCFSIEPGIYLAGRMAARTEIDVFITPSGAVEVYGPIQRELVMIG